MARNNLTTARTSQIVASMVGVVLIGTIVTPTVYFLVPSNDFSVVALTSNGIAIVFGLLTWSGLFLKGKTGYWSCSPHPYEWIGIFFVSLILSLVFVLMDCGWHMHFKFGGLVCDENPGLSVIFTFAAFALTTISIPSAVRAYLLPAPSSEGSRDTETQV